jgi:UDPglucose 6-dehydrogenase
VNLFVVGAGYVGLTTAVGFGQLGHGVVVHDLDPERVGVLAAGRSPIFEAGVEELVASLSATGRLRATADPAPPPETDVAIVCVPTPVRAAGTLDMAIVEAVVANLLEALPSDRAIVVRSTLPLHGADRLEALAAARGGPPILVNPEFMREGRALADFAAPSRVAVGFVPPASLEDAGRIADLYGADGAPVIVGDARSIVLVKLASNVFLGAKIAFADELARLCDAIGADMAVVSDGVGLDPRIGRAFLESGPGFGGSCLPEQADAIAAETRARDVAAPLLTSIARSNETHQAELVISIGRLLPAGLPGTRIALLGLAFKADTDDVRHSPAVVLGRGLRAGGARVVAYDPVAATAARRSDPALETAPTAAEAIEAADAVVVATEWAEFAGLDWHALAPTMRGDLVYDTRRRLDADAVRAAGLRYVALGRANAAAGELARRS